jgi:hypothetical protein
MSRLSIVTAQAGVAVGGEHLEHTVIQFQDREVERAAARS